VYIAATDKKGSGWRLEASGAPDGELRTANASIRGRSFTFENASSKHEMLVRLQFYKKRTALRL
jgi:hypothetical protein